MVRPLKVGVQLAEVEYEYTWPQLAEMARTAEAFGLGSIWLIDHLMNNRGQSKNSAARVRITKLARGAFTLTPIVPRLPVSKK